MAIAKGRLIALVAVWGIATCSVAATATSVSETTGELRLPDGTRLATTTYQPATPLAALPQLLEFTALRRETAPEAWRAGLRALSGRGFVVTVVDARGSGASAGVRADHPFAEREVADARDALRALARRGPARIALVGRGESGTLALRLAAQPPAELAGLFAIGVDDDFFLAAPTLADGALALGLDLLEREQRGVLPASTTAPFDADYFHDRFDRAPWALVLLREQRDGPFFRDASPRFRPGGLALPVHLVAGLDDPPRASAAVRLLELAPAGSVADLGPWRGDDLALERSAAGYDWVAQAAEFFADLGRPAQPSRLNYFVRDGGRGKPGEAAPGRWRSLSLPMASREPRRLFLQANGSLAAAASPEAIVRRRTAPSSGSAFFAGWAPPRESAPLEPGSFVFETAAFVQPLELLGAPRLRVSASAAASQARWIARLEDVGDDGLAEFVTGGLLNAAQRRSRRAPEPLRPGEWEALEFDLHFTTWTVRPGRRLRLVLTNAQFPMLWPAPAAGETRLALGGGSALELPVVPYASGAAPRFAPVGAARAADPPPANWPSALEWTRDLAGQTSRFEWEGERQRREGDAEVTVYRRTVHSVSDRDPAAASFLGEALERYVAPGRSFELETRLEIQADAVSLRVVVTRSLSENGEVVRTRRWEERLPRDLQ